MNLYVTSFQTQTIKHESQFSQSLYLFGFDFWIGISLFFFYTMCSSELYEKPSLIYILDEVAIPQSFQRQIKTCAVYPNSECQCRLLQTYLMNEYFWIVFTILFYQSSIAYFILLDVFYVFKSAATTFPQFFFSAKFGCYIECEQIILWYEDQPFKTELVADYRIFFSCKLCILWERIVLKAHLYA